MLLDTHVWVWAADSATGHFGPRTRRLLDREAALGRAHVSTVSLFEVAALHAAGRLRLALPVESWINESLERGALRVAELTRSIALDGGLVPASALADPFDRLLVATARQLGVPFVTRDRRILDYAAANGTPAVVDAAR